MAQSLFNFNNLTIALSSPPPLSTQNITLSAYIQGVTKAQINYTQLLSLTDNSAFDYDVEHTIRLDIRNKFRIKTDNILHA